MKTQLAYKCPRCRAEIEVGGTSRAAGVFRDFCQYCNSENLIKVQEFKTYKVVQVEKGEGMREIKFRVWDITGKPHYYILQELASTKIIYSNMRVWNEYTGLRDRNGEEVYQGDIISSPNNIIYLVVWSNEHLRWEAEMQNATSGKKYREPLWTIIGGYTKVVGNIYENPELLQAGEK